MRQLNLPNLPKVPLNQKVLQVSLVFMRLQAYFCSLLDSILGGDPERIPEGLLKRVCMSNGKISR